MVSLSKIIIGPLLFAALVGVFGGVNAADDHPPKGADKDHHEVSLLINID